MGGGESQSCRIRTTDGNTGGRPYDDIDVTDEFYWAAAELFITTGKDEYQTYLQKSKHYMTVPQVGGGAAGGALSAMTWQMTQALGTISLAVAPSKLDKDFATAMRASVVAAADAFLGAVNSEGYRIPFRPNGAKNIRGARIRACSTTSSFSRWPSISRRNKNTS